MARTKSGAASFFWSKVTKHSGKAVEQVKDDRRQLRIGVPDW
jgi:hypothetical protein